MLLQILLNIITFIQFHNLTHFVGNVIFLVQKKSMLSIYIALMVLNFQNLKIFHL